MYLANHAVEIFAEFVDVSPLACRDEDTRRIRFGNPTVLQLVECSVLFCGRSEVVLVFGNVGISIDFVEDQENWFVCRSNLLQGLFDYGNLLFKVRVRNIDDVQ